METFNFVLQVTVQVEAFSQTDAEDMIKDVFGPGDDCGVLVTDLKIKEL